MVLVASTRLGTINHILLSLEAAQSGGIEVAGVILVGDDDVDSPGVPGLEKTLREVTRIPILARIPRLLDLSPSEIARVARERFTAEVLNQLIPPQVQVRSDREVSLSERDQGVIWHPFSQHGLGDPILGVVSGRGVYLKLSDGREVIDGISSWWVNLHGHAHPEIAQAIFEQSQKLEHVIFAGFTHDPAVRLAEALVAHPFIRAAGLSKVFYSDNGSTAVEVALKMAFQVHINRGGPPRERFLALSNSYHGDTLGAMAVGEPEGYHKIFRSLLPQVDFVNPGDLSTLKSYLSKNRNQYSAFIFEPLVQGAAGMKMYSPDFLREAVELCQSEGVLTISDEVFTGFYRTGRCFASEYAGIRPDLLCLSKGITGGFLPLSVTLASDQIFEAFLSRDLKTAFLHGHSYTANPVACAAALASWRILQSEDCQSRIASLCHQTEREVAALRRNRRVTSVRSLGTIGVVEVDVSGDYFSGNLKPLGRRALDQGVFIRPLGNVIYVLPPYCMSELELRRVYQVIGELLG
jgi:adenosylmethionine-8-amino-7-oxononanoate aminotransferase